MSACQEPQNREELGSRSCSTSKLQRAFCDRDVPQLQCECPSTPLTYAQNPGFGPHNDRQYIEHQQV